MEQLQSLNKHYLDRIERSDNKDQMLMFLKMLRENQSEINKEISTVRE